MALTLPTVHLNGTSRDQLLEGYINSVNALRHAIEVIQTHAPNMRDYYLVPNGAAAMTEHETRLEKLESVLTELRTIGEHVAGLS